MTSAADFLEAKPAPKRADAFLDADVPRGTQALTDLDEAFERGDANLAIPGAQPRPKREDGPSVAAGVPGAIAALGLSLPGQILGPLWGFYKRVTGSSMDEAGTAAREATDYASYHPSAEGEAALQKAAPLLDALIATQGAMGMMPFGMPGRASTGKGKPPPEPKVEPPPDRKSAPPPPEDPPGGTASTRPFPVPKQEEAPPAESPAKPAPPRPEPPVVENPFPPEAGDLSGIGEPMDESAPAAPSVSTLPRELAGAKPRYSFGDRQFELTFESDFDRAAYIAAQKTLSKRDADYVKWAMRESGLSEAEVRAHGERVRAQIKDEARSREEGGRLTVATVEREAPEAPQLDLTGETEGEIRARETVEAKAREDSARADAAPSAEDFLLTGSERDVDEARAKGQQELVPVEEASVEATPERQLMDTREQGEPVPEFGSVAEAKAHLESVREARRRGESSVDKLMVAEVALRNAKEAEAKGPTADIIQHPEGRPWKTREAAKAYAKMEKIRGYVPWKTEGGFVLKPAERTAAQLAADAKRRTEGSTIDPSRDNLATMAGKLGGINKQSLLDMGIDPASLHPKKGSFRSSRVDRPAVREVGGMSVEDFAESLMHYGMDVFDENGLLDKSKVEEMLFDHINGDPVYAAEGYERMASEQAEHEGKASAAEAQRHLDEFGPGTLGANSFLDPKVIGKVAQDTVRDLFGVPGEFRHAFNTIRDTEQHHVAQIERWATGIGHEIREAFPSKAEREDLTTRIVRGDDVTAFAGLNERQARIARALQAHYQAMGEYAMDAARLEGLRENYSPQIWDMNDRHTRNLIESWNEQKGKTKVDMNGVLAQAMADSGKDPATFSPFTMRRTVNDVIEGMAIGLKPKSLDAAALFETYARSMGTAIERGKALTSLKEMVLEDGSMAVIPREQAPRDYVRIDNPELEGMRVHPDIAPSVRVLMETNNPGVVATVLQTMAYTSKRALVSYSMFHPKALGEAFIGSGGNPRALIPQRLGGNGAIEAALKAYRDGGVGDSIDLMLREGLKIGAPLEDVLGRDKFQWLIDKGASVADRAGAAMTLGKFEKAGSPLRAFRAADEAFNHFTWDYLHTGLKLETATRKFAELKQKELERQEKAQRNKIGDDGEAFRMTPDREIARQVAEYTNALYGGLNWERMLDSFDTPAARRVMSEVLSKRGRSWMSTAMFAPDWMLSSLGSWTNALGTGERNALKRDLAQRYLALSAVATLTIGTGLNYYFTGHSMFENKSDKKDATWRDQLKAKLEVQTGDGRRIQIAKHFMEGPHALIDPIQFGLNKVNPAIAELPEQIGNKQWLTQGWAPPITKKSDTNLQGAAKRALHAGQKFAPITGRQLMEQGPSGLGGFFGFPVYGMSAEQKAKERSERGK